MSKPNPTEVHPVRVSFSAVQAALISMGPGCRAEDVTPAVAAIIPLEVRSGAAPGSIKVYLDLLARLRDLAQALHDPGAEAELRVLLKAVLNAAPAQWVRQAGLPEGVGSYGAR